MESVSVAIRNGDLRSVRVTGKDTVWSNSLSLRVIQPFEIDTASNTLADIKQILKPKLDWKYYAHNCYHHHLSFVALITISDRQVTQASSANSSCHGRVTYQAD